MQLPASSWSNAARTAQQACTFAHSLQVGAPLPLAPVVPVPVALPVAPVVLPVAPVPVPVLPVAPTPVMPVVPPELVPVPPVLLPVEPLEPQFDELAAWARQPRKSLHAPLTHALAAEENAL